MQLFDCSTTINTQQNNVNNPLLKCVVALLTLTLTQKAAAELDLDGPNLAYTDVELYLGASESEFHWSIAGDANGENPNILSELTWRDVRSNGVGISITSVTEKSLIGILDLFYAEIDSGDNQDSDYFDDGRTNEFLRSYSSTDGETLNASYQLGWIHQIVGINLIPLLAITYADQKYNSFDGVTAVNTLVPTDLGPFDGLNSSYDVNWIGAGVGVMLEHQWQSKWYMKFKITSHYFDYNADANWNLRTDFAHPVSFSHEGEGYGLNTNFQLGWQVSTRYRLILRAESLKWRVDEGIDYVFFSDGTEGETQLNEAVLDSTSLFLGIRYTP